MSALFNPVNLLAMLLFAAALFWRIYQLARAPSLPNWAVMTAIAGFAAAFLLLQPAISVPLDDVFGRGAARVANNALLACGLCSLIIFFLGSAMGPRRYGRVAAELIPLAAAITLMVVAMSLTPEPLRGLDTNAQTVHVSGIAAFYLGAGLYLIYGLLACIWWIVRYFRVADRHLRIGLRIGTAGLASMAAGSILRALYIVIAWAFGPVVRALLLIAAPLVILGIVAFLCGITYPGVRARVAAIRRRRQHLRDHRRLAPLWTVLVEAYPSIVLRAAPRGRWDRFSSRGAHRAYYRRVIEIRDGLVQLSPYLETDFAGLADRDAAAAASALRAALARQAAGETNDGRAKQVLPAGADDLESDVRPLLALAAAVSGNGA